MTSKYHGKTAAQVQRQLLRDATPNSHAYDQAEAKRAGQLIISPTVPDESAEYDHLRFRYKLDRVGKRVQTKNGKSWLLYFVDSKEEIWTPKQNAVIPPEEQGDDLGDIKVGLFLSWWVAKQDALQ